MWSECLDQGEGINFGSREEAHPELQALMNVLGDRVFAQARNPEATTRDTAFRFGSLGLDHLHLDNVNLAGKDFSGVSFSQAHLHRVIFSGAILRKTDFRGAKMSDWDVPGRDRVGRDAKGEPIPNWLYLRKSDNEPGIGEIGSPVWRRYRCWVTDFRGAHLEDADFTGALLAGADFSGAFLKGVNFKDAELTDANFEGAVNFDRSKWLTTASGKAR